MRAPPLARDSSGVAALEFALILPVLLLLVFGVIETAMILFIGATLESSVFAASRLGALTGDGTSRAEAIRAIIAEETLGFVDMEAVTIDTLVYSSFANVGQPEPFTDANANGVWNLGESYTDVNGNGRWDSDMGRAGLGGAGDIVVYRVGYAWGLMTPLVGRVMGEEIRLASSIAIRNEPF